MTTRTKLSVAGAVAGAAIMTVLGTGSAQAAPVYPNPTADYQLTGAVWDSTTAAWQATGIPSGATQVANAEIRGELWDTSTNPPTVTYFPGPTASDWGTTKTNATGGFTIQGASSMVSTVTGGGVVKLFVNGGNCGTWSTTGIDASQFLARLYTSFSPLITQSAKGFNCVKP